MAAVLDWTWVRVQLCCLQAKVWPQSANSSHCEVTSLQDIKNTKEWKVCPFSSCQTKNWKKISYKWQFMATFHTQLWVVLPQTKHHLPHFHLTWMAAHPHPSPQCSLSLRWIAYLHSHMTPRGKGARLCASLTRVASALTVPLFSLRDSGVPGTLLLSRLPCPSVGRTGRLCPGEITEHLCGAERRASDRWRSLHKNWVSLHFVSLLQLLFHRLL